MIIACYHTVINAFQTNNVHANCYSTVINAFQTKSVHANCYTTGDDNKA